METDYKSKRTIEDRFCPLLDGLALIGLSYEVGAVDVLVTQRMIEFQQDYTSPGQFSYSAMPLVTLGLAIGAIKLFRKGAESYLGFDLFSNE